MFVSSNLRLSKSFRPLTTIAMRNFQNKIKLTKENIQIINSVAYNKVNVLGLDDKTIKDKTFYFCKKLFCLILFILSY